MILRSDAGDAIHIVTMAGITYVIYTLSIEEVKDAHVLLDRAASSCHDAILQHSSLSLAFSIGACGTWRSLRHSYRSAFSNDLVVSIAISDVSAKPGSTVQCSISEGTYCLMYR
jgi:hypothetical protein